MICKILRDGGVENVKNIIVLTDCAINSPKLGIHGNHYCK